MMTDINHMLTLIEDGESSKTKRETKTERDIKRIRKKLNEAVSGLSFVL
jgi:hypothetical protein